MAEEDGCPAAAERECALPLPFGGFPGGSEGEVSACSVGDLGSIPGLGTSPGEGDGNPLQYSCLGNPMDGGAWWATVRGVTKGQTQLSNFTFTFMYVYSAVSDSSQPHGL